MTVWRAQTLPSFLGVTTTDGIYRGPAPQLSARSFVRVAYMFHGLYVNEWVAYQLRVVTWCQDAAVAGESLVTSFLLANSRRPLMGPFSKNCTYWCNPAMFVVLSDTNLCLDTIPSRSSVDGSLHHHGLVFPLTHTTSCEAFTRQVDLFRLWRPHQDLWQTQDAPELSH